MSIHVSIHVSPHKARHIPTSIHMSIHRQGVARRERRGSRDRADRVGLRVQTASRASRASMVCLCTDLCIDMCIDMCTDMRMDVRTDIRLDLCIDMCRYMRHKRAFASLGVGQCAWWATPCLSIDMYADMCTDMRICMCTDMRICMRTDMGIDCRNDRCHGSQGNNHNYGSPCNH